MVSLGLTGIFQKIPRITKKSTMLRQKRIYTPDLDSYYGVQVSFCTGVARRVCVRELLAEVLPAYMQIPIAKPPQWEALRIKLRGEGIHEDDIMQALCQDDFENSIKGLDNDEQHALAELIVEILNLLSDTGFDEKDQSFTIGCFHPNLSSRCIRIPQGRAMNWTRMLADSTEMATFAYITPRCLQTPHVRCGGAGALWEDFVPLLRTTVLCYKDRPLSREAPVALRPRILGHAETYLLGRPDMALLVIVDRMSEREVAKLRVWKSLIPLDYLFRFSRKCKTGKPRMLKEVGSPDERTEVVLVVPLWRAKGL